MMSLKRINALCEFLFNKVEISLCLKKGRNNWREKARNVCQPKHVGIINYMNKRDVFEHLSINKTTPTKKERQRTETAAN